jgi:hypothetical protein
LRLAPARGDSLIANLPDEVMIFRLFYDPPHRTDSAAIPRMRGRQLRPASLVFNNLSRRHNFYHIARAYIDA